MLSPMSCPGSQLDGYRCDACKRTKNRCAACRARRAARRRQLHAAKRAAGICLECGERALAGERRCAQHQAINTGRSADAHAALARRRKRAGRCRDCDKPAVRARARCALHLRENAKRVAKSRLSAT